MPRLISEIKCPKLRKLAELRRRQENSVRYKNDHIATAFKWGQTAEDFDFWESVDEDKITELPKYHPLYDKL